MWFGKKQGLLDGLLTVSAGRTHRRRQSISRSIRAEVEACERRIVMSAGLTGEYFNNVYSATSDLTHFVKAQKDAPTNWSFNWGNSAPATGVSPNIFSVRWEGQFKAPVSGAYTFYVDPDTNGNGGQGGEQLWVNENLIITKTAPHSTEDSGTTPVSLNAGSTYSLKFEYYNFTGQAYTQLQYSSTAGGLSKGLVPVSNTLYDLANTQAYTAPTPNTNGPVTTPFTGAPAGWSGVDIGQPGNAGNSNYSGGTYNVTGGGTLIGGTNDQLQFAYRQVSGDFTFIGRIKGYTGTPNGGAEAGLMLRTGLTASVPEVFVGSQPDGIPYDTRRWLAAEPETTESAGGGFVQSFPYWLKIVRYGDKVGMYYAPDSSGSPGVWVFRSSQSLNNLSETVSIGLAVGSRTSATCTASFDNVSVTNLSLDHESSWLGDSFGGGESHVMAWAATAFVDQNGQFYLDGGDEDKSLSIYNADGTLAALGNNSHYESGSAIAVDTTFVYQAQNGAYNYDSNGVQLYDHGGIAAGTAILGCDDVTGLATTSGFLFVASDNLIYKFSTSATATPAFVTCWEVDNATNMAADPAGNLWIIQNATSGNATVIHQKTDGLGTSAGSSITFPGTTFAKTVTPRGIAVDLRAGTTNGQVYVTDTGQLQQIHLFDSGGNYIRDYGDAYGVYGGSTDGALGATRFNFPVGVGIDSAGELYVVNAGAPNRWGGGAGNGTVIRKYAPGTTTLGPLLWERDGLTYVDTASPDPATPTNIYTKFYSYTANYNNTTPGQNTTPTGTLVDPFVYPNDPRLLVASGIATAGYSDNESPRAGTIVRDIGGVKFLFDTDQHGSAINIYRFLPNSDITVFCGELSGAADRGSKINDAFYIWIDTNGDGIKQTTEENFGSTALDNVYGWSVDSGGNIWVADEGGTAREYKVSLSHYSNNNPYLTYSSTNMSQWTAPTAFQSTGSLERAVYDSANDVLYVSGFTVANPKAGTDSSWGEAGTELLAYTRFSLYGFSDPNNSGKTNGAAWDQLLPYNANNDYADLAKCIDIAGAYVFNSFTENSAGIQVRSAATGAVVTTIIPGPEVAGGSTNGPDFMDAVTATKLNTGQYVLFSEEVEESKVLMDLWTPGVSLPTRGWTSSDIGSPNLAGSSSFNGATWTINGAGANIWGSNDQEQLAYQSLAGDAASVVAYVTYPKNTSLGTTAKAGVMLRDSTNSNSPFVAVTLEPEANGGTGDVEFIYRTTAGANAASHTVYFGASLTSLWVRLVRTGNTFVGAYSSDNITWTTPSSWTQTMSTIRTLNYVAGLAVCSNNNAYVSTATFANVAIGSSYTDTDIGSTSIAGSATFDAYNNTWTVSGSGGDIQGTSDDFNYNYMPYTGDGTLVARVDSVQKTSVWAKAGVMFRNDTTAASANVALLVTPSNGLTFQWRSTGGATSAVTTGGLASPQWVKLVRAGDTFSGYYSLDGVNWKQIGSTQTVTMNGTINAGLAVTAQNNSALCTAVFDDVAIGSSLALNGIATASSSLTTGGWSLASANDGQDDSVSGNLGWSSNNSLTTNHEEWLQMDMGSMQAISQVVLYPRNDSGNVGYGFPVDFTIQISLDGVNWTTVATQTNYAQPTSGSPQIFNFATTSARYVKVDGTSLRSNPNDSNFYRMQFAEMQIF